jgi:hypothetical protein
VYKYRGYCKIGAYKLPLEALGDTAKEIKAVERQRERERERVEKRKKEKSYPKQMPQNFSKESNKTGPGNSITVPRKTGELGRGALAFVYSSKLMRVMKIGAQGESDLRPRSGRRQNKQIIDREHLERRAP